MQISDTVDVDSLVSYINDIKPYHSKLTDVTIEYQANENVGVGITDASTMALTLSSVWQYNEVSDGQTTIYRIPAAVFARYSKDFHQSTYIGVTDAIPGSPGAYHVPANNALQVSVNGELQVIGVNYTTSLNRTVVQFIGSSIPTSGQIVTLDWAVMDRFFLGIGSDPVVWTEYTIHYSTENSEFDILPYDAQLYDADTATWFFNNEEPDALSVEPYGTVYVEYDSNDQMYFIFSFFKPLALNTPFYLRVEQREAYNGWTQTSITDTVKFQDYFKYYDTVNVQIADPGTWTENETLFGININSQKIGYLDIQNYDTVDFDSLSESLELGYYELFSIQEMPQSVETSSPAIVDALNMAFSDYWGFDCDPFDSVEYEVELSYESVYSPDSLGMIYVAFLSNTVEINHDYGYNPILAAYVGGEMILPRSVTYPSTNVIIVTFDEPCKPVIHIIPSTSGLLYGVYTPNDFGMVYVTALANVIEINHSYGHNPLVAAYSAGSMCLPESVSYPSNTQVILTFAEPREVTIHLA